MPFVMAVMNCATVQPPMPSLVTGEIETRPSPLPSLVLSSCLGTAWQDEQPPIRNMVSPLARSGVGGPSAPVGTVAGIAN